MLCLLITGITLIAGINGQCVPRNGYLQAPIPDKETGLVDGDMRFTKKQLQAFHNIYNVIQIDSEKRWGDIGATLPYVLNDTFSETQVSMIKSSLATITAMTHGCVKFVERTNEKDYVSVFKGSGCWSYVGVSGGMQEMSLNDRCFRIGTIQHEFLHALGFWHEQSRADRDEHVTIMWYNIRSQNCHNFWKYTWETTSNYSQPYDYSSVMHYSGYGFSRNGEPTIVPNDPSATIGQRQEPSAIDIKKLMALYKCSQL